MARKSNLEVLVNAISLLPWWANAFVAVAAYFGFHMLLYLTGLQNIPAEIEEAARMDGAGAYGYGYGYGYGAYGYGYGQGDSGATVAAGSA